MSVKLTPSEELVVALWRAHEKLGAVTLVLPKKFAKTVKGLQDKNLVTFEESATTVTVTFTEEGQSVGEKVGESIVTPVPMTVEEILAAHTKWESEKFTPDRTLQAFALAISLAIAADVTRLIFSPASRLKAHRRARGMQKVSQRFGNFSPLS